MPREPMNVVFITTDQMRADSLGCAGNPIARTPNLDRLAAEGVRAEQMYVAQPLCMPSRSTIITGTTPRTHGVWTNGVALDPDIPTFGQLLSDAGHHTALIGKAHLRPYGFDGGAADPMEVEREDTWEQGLVPDDWHGPYYGFDHVDLTLRHHYLKQGHIGRDLRERAPESIDLIDIEHALEEPTWVGAWKNAVPLEHHPSTWITDRTVKYLENAGEEPFFVWASFPDPHHSFTAPKPYCDHFDLADMRIPEYTDADLDGKPPHVRDVIEGRVVKHEGWGAGAGDLPALTDTDWCQIHAQYYGMVELIDDSVGRILAALEEQGLAENTAVIFTSDHGELFGDHGLLYKGPFPYEGLYRLPFVARIPGVTRVGTMATGPGTLLDLAPTFSDLAGVDALPSFQGRSMLPWLGGGEGREAVLVEFVSRYYPEMTLMTVVTGRWKLTHYPNADRGELYDLQEDPGELVNRWGDSAAADAQRELEGRLLDLTANAIGRLPTPLSHA